MRIGVTYTLYEGQQGRSEVEFPLSTCQGMKYLTHDLRPFKFKSWDIRYATCKERALRQMIGGDCVATCKASFILPGENIAGVRPATASCLRREKS